MGQKWGFYPHFWGPRGDPPGDPILTPFWAQNGAFLTPRGGPPGGVKNGVRDPQKYPKFGLSPCFAILFWPFFGENLSLI